jgi:hypothetical protein
MSMPLILAVSVWLAIAVTLYTGVWFALMRRLGTVGTSLVNLGLSTVMSPGIWAAGHGAIPFPGGVVFLLGGPSQRFDALSAINFAMWMLTFLIFSIYSWHLKRSEID